MKWYNKPLKSVENANSITMTVDPGTDYWRITHYDFIRDNGPFYYTELAGDFEASVKITGELTNISIHSKERKDYSKLDLEMLRVIQLLPKRKPGRCQGREVPVRFILPFIY